MPKEGKKKLSRAERFDKVREWLEDKLATVDGQPSIRGFNGSDYGEWERYSQSKHEMRLLTSIDRWTDEYTENQNLESFEISRDCLRGLIDEAIACRTVDRYLDRIKALKWDGTNRIYDFGKAMGLYLPDEIRNHVGHEEADEYISKIGAMLILGPVERHIHPYNQLIVPILASREQGTGKGSTLQYLAFADSKNEGFHYESKTIDENHAGRHVAEASMGKAITEFAEIDHILNKQSSGFVKTLLEGASTQYDQKYTRGSVTVPWEAFFVGTTNVEDVLVDQTGNRRFAIVRMKKQEDTQHRDLKDSKSPIFLPYHPDYRDQLLAEAYFLLSGNLTTTNDEITESFKETQGIVNEYSISDNPAMGLILKILDEGYGKWQKSAEIDRPRVYRKSWSDLKEEVRQKGAGGQYSPSDMTRAINDFKINAISGKRFGCIFKMQAKVYVKDEGEKNLSCIEVFDIDNLRLNL